MRPAKFLRLACVHLPSACGVLLALAARRALRRGRRSVLVLTHALDVDAEGRDQQMGPLVDALRGAETALVRVVLVPLEPGALGKARRDAGERVLSLAALYAVGRLVGRERIAGFVLWLGDVRACYLIDESASGQMWVRAARRRGVRTVGVQHGDFRTGLAPYAHGGAASVAPVDVFCLWSEWFRERLLRVSPVYTRDNTAVTGRLGHAWIDRPEAPVCNDGASSDAPSDRESRRGEAVRALLLGEATPGFAARMRPFAEALDAASAVQLRVRPHPSAPPETLFPGERSTAGLVADLDWSDVVLGEASSALLEGVRRRRPILVLGPSDPAELVHDGLAERVEDPARLAERCAALRGLASAELCGRAERVWGRREEDPATAVLAVGRP